MSVARNILLRMFGHPRGVLGKLGGMIMARTNAGCGAWVADLLEIGPKDRILEVGYGPGVVIQHVSKRVPDGHVAGVDQSMEMVEQARMRNAAAIRSGRVDLRGGCVASLPFDDDEFDKAFAINSMQLWPDAVAGLCEIKRVMKSGGRIAMGFTRYSGQPKQELTATVTAAGFTKAQMLEADCGFCALAIKP